MHAIPRNLAACGAARRLRAALLLGFAFLASAHAWGTSTAPAHAATSALSATRTAPFADSIVKISASILSNAHSLATLGRKREGSGILIDPETVVTIGYLILEAESVQIETASGRTVPASVIGYDHASGLGLVRALVPIEGAPIALGDSDQVLESQGVLTIGQGEAETTPLVVVSRKSFAGSWEYLLEQPIFTFPPVNNWSGSALLSAEGKLVGVGSLIVEDAASGKPGVPGNLFVPVNLLKPMLANLKNEGRVAGSGRPWLGLTTESIQGRLLVVRVAAQGPADLAGVEAGDLVVGVGEEPVADQADFYRRLWRSGPPGTTIALRVMRLGEIRELELKSIDRHDFVAKPAGI